MSKLERAQEFLSTIEDYLRNTLANEKLSASAQIRRRHLLDKFYALELQANVEHKPGGGSTLHRTDSQNAQHKRAPHKSAGCCKKDAKSCIHKNSGSNEGEDLYEEPVSCDSDHDPTSNGKGSDTEYESYDEEYDDEEGVLYVNQGSEQIGQEQIHLPRSKKQLNNDSAVSSESIKFTGELYKKGLLSWTKCYCVLSDKALVCYRAGKESKVLVKILLSGYETNFLDRDGRYSNIIRIARPGSEHWFYADSKDTAEKWIAHLAAVGCKEHADRVTTEGVERAAPCSTPATKSDSMDSVLTNATSTEGQTNLSGGSSEGSGDGVIQFPSNSATVVPTNTSQAVDKRKKSKLGESLQTLLGTFGKKKGDKLKKALSEACALDPDTHAAGYVNICSELAEDRMWVKRFCVVKNNRLDCYKDPLDDYIEFSLALIGAQIDLVDKSPKKIKIVQDVKEVLLSALVDGDSGKWLGILLRESGFGARLVAGEHASASDADNLSAEGIYDEVYNWEVYDIGGDKQNASSAAPPPPPLPRGPPPKAPPQQQQQQPKLLEESENEYIEPQDVYDRMFDDGLLPVNADESFGLEEALNSAFINIRDGLNKRESSPSREQTSRKPDAGTQSNRPTRSASQSPALKHRDLCPRRAFPVSILMADVANNEDASEVVKCHIGPTIAEDKALLETTQNPILTELRKERQMKGSGKSDKSKLEEKIDELRREYEEIKKKRSVIRGSLQTIESSLEKAQLENEIVKLDKHLEITDKEVTKLSILAQEIDGKSFFRNESLRSSSAGKGAPAKRHGGTMSPTFIHVSRNSSLKETSFAVHRTTSSGSLDQKFNTISTSSSPLRARKVDLSDKRASLSDTSPSSGISMTKTRVEIQTRTVSTLRSSADGKGTSAGVSRPSSASTGTRSASQHSLMSSAVGDKAQDGKAPDLGGMTRISLSAAAASIRPLSGCVPAKERPLLNSDLSNRSLSAMNRAAEEPSSSSETRTTSGKVVQEKLKLWESLSDAGSAS